MELIKIIILAVVQGVTEFLPISSDGHLSIAQVALHIEEDNLALTVGLHAGTLLSIVLYYFKDFRDLLFNWRNEQGVFTLLGRRRVLVCIVLGTIPTGIIGLALRASVEQWTTNTLLVGIFLIATGGMNAVVVWASRKNDGRRAEGLRYTDALLIGVAQGLAVLPGLSRSGSTIAFGTALGLDKEFAARFSFLLSVPSVIAAIALYSSDLVGVTGGINPVDMLIGMVVAFGVGVGALHLLITILKRGRFGVFALYCFVMGPLVIALGHFGIL